MTNGEIATLLASKLIELGSDARGKCNRMTWPLPAERMGELEWKLRYANATLTRKDLLYAASIIDGYRQLVVYDTQKIRNGKIEQIRRARSAHSASVESGKP